MCDEQEHGVKYTEFPSRIIGGPSGNYSIQCDVTSCQWAEFIVTGISNGAAAAATVVVNGNSPMTSANALNYVGAVTINDDNCPKGSSYSVLASTTIPAPMVLWERITNSQKKVFIRIDAGNSNSCYVNIRFRIAELKVIPSPSVTVHPDHMQQMNIARSEATRQRLGLKREIERGEGMNAGPHRAKKEDELHGQR